MNQERQKEFVEDAVIRMRDLRDQQDCFSQEEFKRMLSAMFRWVAGVIPRKTREERKKNLIEAVSRCAVILVGWGYLIAQGADLYWLIMVFIPVGVPLVLMAFGALLDSLTIRSVRRISSSTRFAAVDALTVEGLITEKQDKVIRLLIDEAEKPERFEWREKSA